MKRVRLRSKPESLQKVGSASCIRLTPTANRQVRLSWQIVPSVLDRMINQGDPIKSERVMKEMIRMVKLDIDALTRAYERTDGQQG